MAVARRGSDWTKRYGKFELRIFIFFKKNPNNIIAFNNRQQAKQFAPECAALCALGGEGHQNGSLGLNYLSDVEPQRRAAVECCVTGMILAGQKENLQRLGNGDILKSFMGEFTNNNLP